MVAIEVWTFNVFDCFANTYLCLKKPFKQDKHIKYIYSPSGFGETQIAANIIACVDENIRATDNEEPTDETIFAMRVLSTYVTFYKAEFPAKYWPNLLVVYQRRKLLLKDGRGKMLSGKVWI